MNLGDCLQTMPGKKTLDSESKTLRFALQSCER